MKSKEFMGIYHAAGTCKASAYNSKCLIEHLSHVDPRAVAQRECSTTSRSS